MTSKIKLENLYKSFGPKHVLTGVDLDIKQGESIVIIGGSGSGKSVMLKLIIGLMHPDSGKILIDEEDTSKFNKQKKAEFYKKIGFLFQGGALFDSFKIWENIAFQMINQQPDKLKEAREMAIKKLRDVGLDETVADLYPAELSGGMQKRVALARATFLNPEIIFFDEPTTGLDPIMANVINDLIIKHRTELGATTITITHDMNSAKRIASRVIMLYKGKIVWDGPIEKLESSGNAYIEQFISGGSEGPIAIEIQDH